MDSGTGDKVWQVWVAEDNGTLEERRPGDKSQAGRENLEEGRTESTQEATEEGEGRVLLMAPVSG